MGSSVTRKSFFNMFSLLLLVTFLQGFEQIQGFSTEGHSSLIGSNSSEPGANREGRRSVVSGGLFSIVTFENVPCNASTGDIGTCYSGRECTNMGGTASGICANNFGVCCLVQTSSGTVGANNTYWTNPGYPTPSTGPLQSSITVTRLANAAWLYIEYIDFDIRGPSGTCTNDTFIVSLASTTSSAECGILTGTDEYISWDAVTIFRSARQLATTATLTITLAAGSDPRKWKIRIVQFKATDACAPPNGCNQYYRDLTGTFESPNYQNGQGEIVSTGRCRNQCFALPSGYCGVTISSTCVNDANCGFMVPGTSPSTCGSDYLMVGSTRYCGDTFGNNGVATATRVGSANYVSVSFCTGTSNPNMDVGYRLMYTLTRC